jgi:hypothetical protein
MSLQSYHLAWLQAHPERSAEWLANKLQEGFHIHHVDFDHSNDAPDNLVLVFGVDHLANLHGWKLRPRKPAQPLLEHAAEPIAEATRCAPNRAYANPSTFKRDAAAFVKWQESMSYSNLDAARALYVSVNTITEFRKRGAPAKKVIEMLAIVAGIQPDTPWKECERLAVFNKALKEVSRIDAPNLIPSL